MRFVLAMRRSVCLILMTVCFLAGYGLFAGDAAWAEEPADGDPMYWRYYDENGNLKDDGDEIFDWGDIISSDPAGDSIDVTKGSIYSPFAKKSYYTKNGTIAHGVDISKWNDYVDWKKVKAAGVDYAWIRCAYRTGDYGSLYEDYKFQDNIKRALEADVKVGVYIYSQAINKAEAREEARMCIDLLGDNLFRLSLPIIMDVEYITETSGRLYRAHLSCSEQTNICLAFADEIKAHGSVAGIYTGFNFVNPDWGLKLNPRTLDKEGVGLWLARYNNHTGYDYSDYYAWQYSESYKLAGCTGNGGRVDLNFIYEDCLPAMNIDDSMCTFTSDAGPEGFAATAEKDRVVLTWEKKKGAYGYVIRRKKPGKSWHNIGMIWNSKITSFEDTEAKDDTVYMYQVSAILSQDARTRSQYSAGIYGMKRLTPPAASGSASAVATDGSGRISISWGSVAGASSYRIDRKVGNGSYEKLTEVGADVTSYKDKTVVMGPDYTYRVCAYYTLPDKTRIKGCYCSGIEKKLVPARPEMTMAEAVSSNAIKLIWTPVPDVSGYKIYRRRTDGSYGEALAVIPANKNNSLMSYKDTEPECGVSYYYKVQSYKATEDYGDVGSRFGPSSKANTIPKMVKLKNLKSIGFKRLRLFWKSVPDVDGYQIQRVLPDGTRVKVADVGANTTNYKLEGLICGKQYTYSVRAFVRYRGQQVFGEVNPLGLQARPVPKAPRTKVSSNSSGRVRITWSKVRGATGYKVYYKTSKKGKITLVSSVKANANRKKILTGRGGRYAYFGVRAYRMVYGKRVFGPYEWKKVLVMK